MWFWSLAMSPRSAWFCAAILICLAPASASADLVPVISYDMNNGDGQGQLASYNYFDFTYTNNTTHQVDANANTSGSNLPIPSNAAPQVAPLTGGTGILTDGVVATQNWSVVSSATGTITSPYAGSLVGQPTEYVGWKYQDPTIAFHLAAGQDVSSISLYVAAYNSALGDGNGLVAAPKNVLLTVGGKLISTTFSLTAINQNTDVITLSGFSISSSSIFDLQLMRGPLQQDGIDYYNQFVKCGSACGPDTDGFRTQAAGGQTGDLLPNSGLEPWLMLSEVEFFAAAVPEPSTWVLMMAGFVGLGWAANRRSARPCLS